MKTTTQAHAYAHTHKYPLTHLHIARAHAYPVNPLFMRFWCVPKSLFAFIHICILTTPFMQLNYDVFNCLDIMDNMEFLRELKFGLGDGHLQYYLYNWRCTQFTPQQMGLVLL